MTAKKQNLIPHAQIRRLMREMTNRNISDKAVIEVERFLLLKIQSYCKEAKKIMGYKKRKSLFPEDLEFKIYGNIGETNKKISLASIKRIIRRENIQLIRNGSTEKIINRLVKLIRDISREADITSESAGMKTIKKNHIKHSLIFINDN